MAGNNSIQILRGTSANIVAANSSQTLQAGQPLYNTDKNYLTIGGADGDALTKAPIAARQLTFYAQDSDTSITNNTMLAASIKGIFNIVTGTSIYYNASGWHNFYVGGESGNKNVLSLSELSYSLNAGSSQYISANSIGTQIQTGNFRIRPNNGAPADSIMSATKDNVLFYANSLFQTTAPCITMVSNSSNGLHLASSTGSVYINSGSQLRINVANNSFYVQGNSGNLGEFRVSSTVPGNSDLTIGLKPSAGGGLAPAITAAWKTDTSALLSQFMYSLPNRSGTIALKDGASYMYSVAMCVNISNSAYLGVSKGGFTFTTSSRIITNSTDSAVSNIIKVGNALINEYGEFKVFPATGRSGTGVAGNSNYADLVSVSFSRQDASNVLIWFSTLSDTLNPRIRSLPTAGGPAALWTFRLYEQEL